jgi:pimeloyl-ACP methyl ester carboxylesterase
MLCLNLRHGGTSSWRFAKEAVWSWAVTGERLSPIEARHILERADVVEFFIHGYNVDDPLAPYYQLKGGLDERAGFAGITRKRIRVFVLWPGSRWEIAFPLARRRAPEAGRLLAEALAGMELRAKVLQGHSMGGGVAVEALAHGLSADLVVLAGAAIDNESLSWGGKYFDVVMQRARLVMVAYSQHDAVLSKAYVIASFDKAIGHTGPRPMETVACNVSAKDLSPTVKKHSDYKSDFHFLDAWLQAEREVLGG